jgi:HlyD family secretion protein
LIGAACSRSAAEFYDARGTVEVPRDRSRRDDRGTGDLRPGEEGATVRAGDTVALLSQIDLGATLAAQGARVAGATANLRDLEAGARPEELRRAEAEVAAATAELDRAGRELARMRELASRDVVSRQTLDNAVTAERVARATAAAAEEAPACSGRGHARTVSRRAAPTWPARGRPGAGRSPGSGPDAGGVGERHRALPKRRAGEALAPNVPVVTIGETARPFVRVFVPQSEVVNLAVGSTAQVITEDGRSMGGRVVAINPKAEFTRGSRCPSRSAPISCSA